MTDNTAAMIDCLERYITPEQYAELTAEDKLRYRHDYTADRFVRIPAGVPDMEEWLAKQLRPMIRRRRFRIWRLFGKRLAIRQ